MSVSIKKAEDRKRIVWGEVYAPNRPDSDGDFMTAEDIEKMAYKFMMDLNLKNIDVQHDNNLVEGACIVESFIARPGDPVFIEGAWVVAVYVPDDETWDKIENQEINGFSMEALVNRQVVEVELEVPPVIMGRTDKVEDHEHLFYVAYDKDGNFLGGKTDTINGHMHLIRRGTITEKSDDHEHRFSFVENIEVIPVE